MKFNRLPAGFVIPAQSVPVSKPPSGADWVYEIKRDGYRLIVRRDGFGARLYSATRMSRPCDCRPLLQLPSGSRPRASRLMARRLCSGLMACHGSRSCPARRPLEPRSSRPSILSSMMVRICAIARSWIGRLRWRSC